MRIVPTSSSNAERITVKKYLKNGKSFNAYTIKSDFFAVVGSVVNNFLTKLWQAFSAATENKQTEKQVIYRMQK